MKMEKIDKKNYLYLFMYISTTNVVNAAALMCHPTNESRHYKQVAVVKASGDKLAMVAFDFLLGVCSRRNATQSSLHTH